MNNFHEQAMSFVYQQVLHRLQGFLERTERIALQLLIQRLLVAAGGLERLAQYRVMVVLEGGRECAYTLAFLRAAQLSIAGRYPDTFILRVAILHQPRLTPRVLERIQTQCSELFLYDDHRVELLFVNDKGVRRLDKPLGGIHKPCTTNRTMMLMSGHLTRGDARGTFFYADLLARAKLFSSAFEWGQPADALIDRRPPRHLARYMAWIQRVASQRGHAGQPVNGDDLQTSVRLCSFLDDDYKDVLCLPPTDQPCNPFTDDTKIAVLNVFDCLFTDIDMFNSRLLTYLHGSFALKDLDIEEPQVAVIVLAAHLQGLRAACEQRLSYRAAVELYWQQAATQYPPNERLKGQLIKLLGTAFNTPRRIDQMRLITARYLDELHGVSDVQLGCFIYSPFINEGQNLELFLRNCYPEKLPFINEYHQMMMHKPLSTPVDVTWLEHVSGLPLSSIQVLYRMQHVQFREDDSLMTSLWASDPHKQPWALV